MKLKKGDLVKISSRSHVVNETIDKDMIYMILDIIPMGYKDSCMYIFIGDKIFNFKIWENSSTHLIKVN
jgi:hypothetical protein